MSKELPSTMDVQEVVQMDVVHSKHGGIVPEKPVLRIVLLP